MRAGNPGVVRTPDGQKYLVQEGHKQVVYDEIVQAAGQIAAGTFQMFFNNQTQKSLLSTNINNGSKLPSGTVLEVERVGVAILGVYGNTLLLGSDFRKIAESASLDFKINKIEMAQGPITHFPGGYGVFGHTNESNASVLTIGTPVEAGLDGVVNPYALDDRFDILPKLTFDTRGWDGSAVRPTTIGRAYLRFELVGVFYIAATLGK